MSDDPSEQVLSADSADTHAILRQDRAIEGADDDALDRGPFVQSLIRSVVSTERDLRGRIVGRRSTGFVVGLTGEWGLGKSSILNLVKEQLDSFEHVAVATINPWLFKNRDDLLKAYFSALREALGKTLKERARAVQNQLEKYKTAIGIGGTVAAAAIDMHGGSGVATAAWKTKGKPAVDKLQKAPDLSPDDERKSLEKKLAKSQTAVVVLIDELDRVEDEEVRAVAQMIKAVGDIKGISYLVAYDPKRVAQALGRGDNPEDRQKSGEAYLEKIVQFAIPLRPLFEEDILALLNAALARNSISLPSDRETHEEEIVAELVRNVRTPREIKRLVGAFSVLEEVTRGEICPYDVLGYAYVTTKSPTIREAIARNFDAMVSDPSKRELLRRIPLRAPGAVPSDTLETALGMSVAPYEDLLKLLFPRFGKDDGVNAGNRIGKRRNLVRLLYLGNPPGSLPRSEIERLWKAPTIARAESLIRGLIETDRLALLLDRLLDLMIDLDPAYDTIFWPALARCLVRQHDWITEQEALGGLAGDAASILRKYGWLGIEFVQRGRAIFDSLVADGDLILAPNIMRHHIYAYAINRKGEPDDSDTIFTLEETIGYLKTETARYAKAVSNGTFLKRIPDTELMYALLNMKSWGKVLQKRLTDQLDSMDAITTFAALTIPPGIIVDSATMDRLIDTGVVLERLSQFAKDGLLPNNQWLRASLTRFAAVMRRHDPHFAHRHGSADYIANGSTE